MTEEEVRSMASNTDPDLALLDELGIRIVANALDLSVEAVRRWRTRGTIPDQRRDELRSLVANQAEPVPNQEPPGSEPAEAEVPNPPGRLGTSLPTVIPQDPAPVGIDLDRIQGADAVIQVEAMIAERAVRQAEAAAQYATRRIPDVMPEAAVPRYWLRLFGLFLLEFPVLTMAFVPVAEVSPIVAAGSAAALALFLVLGAHVLGAPLRSLGDQLPAA
jgi:hypothetical protein